MFKTEMQPKKTEKFTKNIYLLLFLGKLEYENNYFGFETFVVTLTDVPRWGFVVTISIIHSAKI